MLIIHILHISSLIGYYLCTLVLAGECLSMFRRETARTWAGDNAVWRVHPAENSIYMRACVFFCLCFVHSVLAFIPFKGLTVR